MKDNEIKHIKKILDLAQDLNQEIAKAKICCDDIPENTFDLNQYMDDLFAQHNAIEDADIDYEGEDVATYLSSASQKNLIISLIIALCVSRTINLADIVVALDTVQDINK